MTLRLPTSLAGSEARRPVVTCVVTIFSVCPVSELIHYAALVHRYLLAVVSFHSRTWWFAIPHPVNFIRISRRVPDRRITHRRIRIRIVSRRPRAAAISRVKQVHYNADRNDLAPADRKPHQTSRQRQIRILRKYRRNMHEDTDDRVAEFSQGRRLPEGL